MAHELGHTLALAKFKSFVPDGWSTVAKADRSSVSLYGKTHLQEDFAEAMRFYLTTDGGTKVPYYLNRLSNRFEYIDVLMKMPPKVRTEALVQYKKNLVDNQGIYLFAGGSGGLFLADKGAHFDGK